VERASRQVSESAALRAQSQIDGIHYTQYCHPERSEIESHLFVMLVRSDIQLELKVR
jgi:hypothetical protein